MQRNSGTRQLLPVLMRENYQRRSLTPLFLRENAQFPRSKSICSATTQLVKLPTKPEAERLIKSTRRLEYDQKIRMKKRTSKQKLQITPILSSFKVYLRKKRAVVLIQGFFRGWIRRKMREKQKSAGRIIGIWWENRKNQYKKRKIAQWLFLLCIYLRKSASNYVKSRYRHSLSIQCVFRRFLSHEYLPSPPPTKRKSLVENFKHFIVSSQIEQAVIAFRWNMELTRRRRMIVRGLRDLQRVVGRVLCRQLGPAVGMIRRNYEECERARKYRLGKERQMQRFMIRDQKTLQTLSHKLAIVTSPVPQVTPAPALLGRLQGLISLLLD